MPHNEPVSECDFQRHAAGRWACLVCNWLYPLDADKPPRRNCPGPAAEQAARIADAAARLDVPEREARRHAAALLRWARAGFPERPIADATYALTLCSHCEHLDGDRCECGGCGQGRRLPRTRAVRMDTESCPGYRW